MKDLALHILDIAQNSIAAGADMIEISVNQDSEGNRIGIIIKDNGKGMSEEMLVRVTDPYVTSRKTRKVGLGLPLLKQIAEHCGGSLKLFSEPGKGTEVHACFSASHIDLPPWGDLAGVIILLVAANPDLEFLYFHRTKKGQYSFDTREIKNTLDGVPIEEPEVRKFLKEMTEDNLKEIGACG